MIGGNKELGILHLRLHRDHLYIGIDDFTTYLAGCASVILLRDADHLLILPVSHQEAGGFYIKQINARGDRAIHAGDFFRSNHINDDLSIELEARPAPNMSGFIVADLFNCKLSLQLKMN